MAKLTKEKAEAVAGAEVKDFEAIPGGVYHARLVGVDPTGEGAKGPYWTWEYEIAEGEHAKRKLWNVTSLSDAAAGIMKATFDAFGVPTDTDTDELHGRFVKLVVSTRTIEQGARKGQIGNNVDRILPPDEDFSPDSESAESNGSSSGDDIFS